MYLYKPKAIATNRFSTTIVFFFFFFFFGLIHSIWKFLGQGSNLSGRCDLHHSCSNTRSLTHCTRLESELMLRQRPETLQRQCWILDPWELHYWVLLTHNHHGIMGF